MNSLTDNCWGWFYDNQITNGPSNVGQSTFMVFRVEMLYATQIVIGSIRISARRYLSGAWSSWT